MSGDDPEPTATDGEHTEDRAAAPGESERAEPATGPAAFDDALSVLGDETRLRILTELAAVANEDGMGSGLSFSALRERAGVRDSGRFNYHLDKLTDRFVTKVDDEYVARYPGLAVVAAMYAGTFRDTGAADEAAAPAAGVSCPRAGCTQPVEVRYEEDTLFSGVRLVCPDHGSFDDYPVPPGARAGRSLPELMNVAYRRAHETIGLGREGVCAECWGSVTVTYPVASPIDDADGMVWTEVACERCWTRLRPPLRNLLLSQPLVSGLLYEHGYDLLGAAELLTGLDGELECETELLGTDPSRARLRLAIGDDRLELVVDEDGGVVDHERTRVDG